MVLYAIHDALVKPMPSGNNTPSLAEPWTASKDGLTYEFVLRKGVKFHNGEPVTAEDVKFSFDRYRGASAKLLKDRVREVQAVGAGPYRVVSFTPGSGAGHGSLRGLLAQDAQRQAARVPEHARGDHARRRAQEGRGGHHVPPEWPVAEEIKRTSGLRLVAAYPPGVFWLDFPEQFDPKSPWHDRRVRLAASHAIDRQALNQAETLGFSRPTGGLLHRSLDFTRVFEPPAYDPGRARQLLAEAGYRNGYAYGVIPEVEDLFQRQARELDRKKREALLHQIQQILHDRVTHVPVYELVFLWGVGPRVEEAGVDLIKSFAYSGPYEDLRLKRQ